ncbi:hypothetical protein CGRA01v4_00686 [Colletotrichum graminicola]|nr:hypothetical protein CGRA01v4_00686 [Colletotrichum graminicola]
MLFPFAPRFLLLLFFRVFFFFSIESVRVLRYRYKPCHLFLYTPPNPPQMECYIRSIDLLLLLFHALGH